MGFSSLVGTVSELEGHLREGDHEKDANSVHDVEEDDLRHQELSACFMSRVCCARLSIFAEVRVVGHHVTNETENSVEEGDLIDLEEEHATHAGRGEQNDGSNPLDNVEQSQKEEGIVINFSGLLGRIATDIAVAERLVQGNILVLASVCPVFEGVHSDIR